MYDDGVASLQGYGDEQAYGTGMRASYGNIPMVTMAGAYSAPGYANNGFSDIGGRVRPLTYTPPARVSTGYYGMYQQQTGFVRGAFGMLGLEGVSRGMGHGEHILNTAGDFGERVGMGAAGGLTMAGGIALGGALTSMGGVAAGRFLGQAVGSTVGMAGLGGMVGAGAAMFALPMAGVALAESIQQAVQQRRDISNFLESSSFRFVGAGSNMADPRTGAGMSRSARTEVSDFMQGLNVKDRLFDMGDLTNILKTSTNLGMFNGVSEMDDFKKKFKDVVEGVKTVTRVLHQTLDEGLKTMKELKAIGVDPSQAASVVRQADALGKVAGRTGAEMIGLGMQGAELFRGTGVSMSIGMQANMMNIAQIRAARDAGLISQEAISQAGGEEALAQRQTASGLGFAQSAMGRGWGAAFFSPGMNAGFNQQAFMSNIMAGGGSFTGQMAQAAGNMGSPARLIQFQANQERFMSEVGKTFGGQGLQMMQAAASMSEASYLKSIVGGSMEDAFRFSLQNRGMSNAEIQALIGKIRGSEDVLKSSMAGAQATYQSAVTDEASENFVFNRVGKQIRNFGSRAIDAVAAPINRMVDSVQESMVNFKEQQIYGIQRFDVGKTGYQRFLNLDSVAPAARGTADLDKGGLLSTTAGEALMRNINKDKELAASFGLVTGTGGDVILEHNMMRPNVTITKEALAKAQASLRKLSFTDADVSEAEKSGKLKQSRFESALFSGKLDNVSNFKQLSETVYGKKFDDLSVDELKALRSQTKGIGIFDRMFENARDLNNGVQNGKHSQSVSELQDQSKSLAEAKLRIEGKLTHKEDGRLKKVNFSDDVFSKLLLARNLKGKDDKEAQRLQEEAMAEQMKDDPNAKMGDVRSMVKEFMSSDAIKGEVSQATGAMRAIGSMQTERGYQMSREAIMADIGTVSDARTAAQLEKVLPKLGSAGALLAATSGEQALLKATGMGRFMLKQRESLQILGKELEGAHGDENKIRSILQKSGVKDQSELAALTSDVMRGDMKSVLQSSLDRTMRGFTTDKDVAAPGGAGKELTQQGTALENLNQMTKINAEVYSALKALSEKLKR